MADPATELQVTMLSGPDAGRTVTLASDRVTVGRDVDCDVVLGDEQVSRRHLRIEVFRDGQPAIRDLGSRNGTFLDDVRIERVALLAPGQRVRLGDTVLAVRSARQAAAVAGRETVVAPVERVVPQAAQSSAAASAPPEAPLPAPPLPAPAPPSGPGQMTMLRAALRRSSRRTYLAVAVALAAVAGLTAALVLGVLPGQSSSGSVEELVAAVAPSTVLVAAEDGSGLSGVGTGWVLDADDGLIVTNYHVISVGEDLSVGVADEARDATVVAGAPCEDLAVLQVDDATDLRTLPLGSQDSLRQGQTVVALGFPLNASLRDDLTATTGVVSVVQTQFDLEAFDVPRYPNVIQTDAAINPGNSGGPLVTLEGDLVGVNSAGITMADGEIIQGQSYAIGVDRTREIVDVLRTGRSLGWAGMGLEPVFTGGELTDVGLPARPGLLVTHAVAGSPAAEAGVGETPALLIAVDGQPMDGSLPTYCDAVEGLDGDGPVTFTLIPADRQRPLDVDLELG